MPLLPTFDTVHSDLVTFTVMIGGEALPPTVQVKSITINREVNRIPYAVLQILDGDPAEQTFEASSSDFFLAGNDIEIQVGFHSEEDTVFKGMVIGQSLKIKRGRSAILEVECKHKAIKMTTTPRSTFYKEMSDSDIFSEILSKYSLGGDVAETSVIHKEMVQWQTTDWDFLVRRAEANGLVVICTDDGVSVQNPAEAENSEAEFAYGRTLYEFEGEMDARHQLAGAVSEAWDFANQEIIEEEADEPATASAGDLSGAEIAESLGSDPYELSHSGAVESQELQAWADAKLLRSRLAKICGRARVEGTPHVSVGQLISLAGLGERFNGEHFVSGIRHDISNGNWFTDIQIGLSPNHFQNLFSKNEKPAEKLLPTLNGLQIGTVSQLESDPDGEDRILIKIPVVDAEDEGIWARTALLDAGDNRGTFFRPEIGDEVIVGFINDDPRDAVVLGALHSSAKPAPVSATDDNHLKGIYTRSEMKLEFDDDKSSITLKTPRGNTLVLDDNAGNILLKDSNGNKIEMTSSGIVIKSAGSLDLKAATDFNLEGVNVTQQARVDFKAKGGVNAELSANVQTVVKGAMVLIN